MAHANIDQWAPEVISLYNRMSRAIEKRRGIQLSPTDVDMLILTGAYETLLLAVAAEHRRSAQARADAKRPPPESEHPV